MRVKTCVVCSHLQAKDKTKWLIILSLPASDLHINVLQLMHNFCSFTDSLHSVDCKHNTDDTEDPCSVLTCGCEISVSHDSICFIDSVSVLFCSQNPFFFTDTLTSRD